MLRLWPLGHSQATQIYSHQNLELINAYTKHCQMSSACPRSQHEPTLVLSDPENHMLPFVRQHINFNFVYQDANVTHHWTRLIRDCPDQERMEHVVASHVQSRSCGQKFKVNWTTWMKPQRTWLNWNGLPSGDPGSNSDHSCYKYGKTCKRIVPDTRW